MVLPPTRRQGRRPCAVMDQAQRCATLSRRNMAPCRLDRRRDGPASSPRLTLQVQTAAEASRRASRPPNRRAPSSTRKGHTSRMEGRLPRRRRRLRRPRVPRPASRMVAARGCRPSVTTRQPWRGRAQRMTRSEAWRSEAWGCLPRRAQRQTRARGMLHRCARLRRRRRSRQPSRQASPRVAQTPRRGGTGNTSHSLPARAASGGRTSSCGSSRFLTRVTRTHPPPARSGRGRRARRSREHRAQGAVDQAGGGTRRVRLVREEGRDVSS